MIYIFFFKMINIQRHEAGTCFETLVCFLYGAKFVLAHQNENCYVSFNDDDDDVETCCWLSFLHNCEHIFFLFSRILPSSLLTLPERKLGIPLGSSHWITNNNGSFFWLRWNSIASRESSLLYKFINILFKSNESLYESKM